MKKNNKKGFTLVELLAVIVILAILAVAAYTIVIPKLNENKPKPFISDISALVDAYIAYTGAGGTVQTQSGVKICTSSSCNTTSTSTTVSCDYVTVKKLIDEGYIKIVNKEAVGSVALCNKQYYVSYSNGSYMTDNANSMKMINVNRISAVGTTLKGFKECGGSTGTTCASNTSLSSNQMVRDFD